MSTRLLVVTRELEVRLTPYYCCHLNPNHTQLAELCRSWQVRQFVLTRGGTVADVA